MLHRSPHTCLALTLSILLACADRPTDVPRAGSDAPLSPPGSPSSQGATAAAPPVLWLPLEEGSGTTTTDASGNGNDGTLINGTAWGQGGVVLDGSNDYLQVAHAASLDQTVALTVAAWIKPNTIGDWDGIASKGTSSLSYTFNLASSGALRFRAQPTSGNSSQWDSNARVTIGRWQHVAVTWDGAQIRFYINGVLDSNRPNAQFTLRTNTQPLVIGADIPGSSVQYFDGALRDVRVHAAALGDADIGALASALAPQPVGAFVNGRLPATTPGQPDGYTIVPAFPGLRFDDPLVIRPAPNSNRLWVGSRQGVIHSFVNDANVSSKDPFLTLTRCAEVWDGGLLGLAFHPQFGVPGSLNRGYVYIYYCWSPDNDYPRTYEDSNGFFDCYLRLSRFTVPDGSLAADPNSESVMLHLRLYNGSHRSGDIAFGPDGFLYVPIGDQFRYETAQRLNDNLEGGIARIDVDRDPGRSHAPRRKMPLGNPEEISGQGYWIPDDNPFLDPTGANFEEWFSIGHRNPHRMTFDSVTGRIWSGEVGDSKREEINVIEKGRNYGWPFREGLIAGPRSQPPQVYGIVTNPVLDFQRTEANAIIGGYVYRGSEFPGLYGKYLCIDHRQHRVFALTHDPQAGTATKVVLTNFTPQFAITFGQDHSGELFIGTQHENATLYKLAPQGSTAQPPSLLSQTGVFTDLAALQTVPGILPYGLQAPFWSDGASKRRWIAIPNDGAHDTDAETVVFDARNDWTFPNGTVLIKHFELPIDERNPNLTRRLETRLLVRGNDGVFYGVTYRWLPDGSDAVLLGAAGMEEDIAVRSADGSTRVQRWTYPSRIDCRNCHQTGVLGPRTHQLNGAFGYAGGTENQLRVWNRLGLFRTALATATIPALPRSANVADLTQTLDDRTRAYLDSNCASCHRPDTGNRAAFDARLTTPLAGQDLLNAAVFDDLGIPGARVVVPQDPDRSIAWQRLATLGAPAMPPLAKNVVHAPGVETLRQWIWSLAPTSRTVTLGHPIDNLPSIDGWWHNMLVDEANVYVNDTGAVRDVQVAAFRFFAQQKRGALTPFVVKVLGDNNFVVAAVGTSREESDYRIGTNVFAFAEGTPPVFRLQPGEVLAAGFLDARADGSGGSNGGIVPYCTCNGTNELWYTGGPNSGDSGRVSVGAPPVAGAQTQQEHRIYAFAIDFCDCDERARVVVGNGSGAHTTGDSWRSNLVVNEADTYTNTSGAPQPVWLEAFTFFAERTADPVTPFVVRVLGNDNFIVLAVGTTRTALEYRAGDNAFAFDAAGPAMLTLAPGETIAIGFLDAFADGTGGGSGAVIPFAPGGDAVWHTGGAGGGDSGSVSVGNAPQAGSTVQQQARSYAFAMRLRRGAAGTPATLGHTVSDRSELDAWAAQLVISPASGYRNNGAVPVRVDVESFRFWARAAGGPLTPFVVKVRGADAFDVVAIGTTRNDYGGGANALPFLEGGPVEIVVGPGESIAPGFLAAEADGSGAQAATIPFSEGEAVWLSGGPDSGDTARLRFAEPPVRGRYVVPGGRGSSGNGFDSLPVSRDYAFAIDVRVR